jgi:drug/metabolite transporter (DMT)-like permease
MDNLRGIVLMTAAMAGFAMEDMLIKRVSAHLPVGQILLVLGVAGAFVFALMARRQGVVFWSARALHPAVLLRNVAEMVGTIGFVTALALVPLSTASAILQASPLAVTLGAALFLGERVGWRRWSAIAVGFLGVLIVIRPGMETFQPNSLWAVLGVIGLSARDLATRGVPRDVTTIQLSAWGFAAVGILGAGMLAVTGGAAMPDVPQAAHLAAALAFGVASYWAMTTATRVGDVSSIMPFRYTRLVFALALGAIVFGERPDLPTLAGAALVIGSGLYTLARERRLRALSLQGRTG